ncbi:aminopeptidase P family protein [Bradyrhizobium sp. U87765 SZCCT0131]|uniref:aminopeptidase P family protein n=1 Tax=unclassified Bradyrhizobium TaxID=2631580 RepID=UPI001BA716D0|nr:MULTISPECIES: aminopeptidase P family protein [unclassified Bradyrhizobium]MBR1218359.1 aminopeptidase P family protein [Bradyrhizobium sp. U87765 SZCCT0131]MBR1260695.1 aminopeptidase P family protein [Bradyrhizobium sp. U87765 SZCCT0134]MBR1303857.1 aminopeptidase P family protein [Bradyrhizobium sp. U87765 SZCCT0110]MBR1319463.1 aminopeptidase P family protein [Bradyrhizobium sp. U87765 SZCCT0109]MBR1347788.1 aminopeptidase P family protein [Bradyrhizobium sp. U87765 SZCCT0048]
MFEAHFQTFEDPEGGIALTARLAALREELARRHLTGFVVPRADQQQNEYVPPSDERLAWLTGFTGSAGLAAILPDKAAVFVDGRYTLQAAKQVDTSAWSVESLIDPPPEKWLETHLSPGARLGFDPWLHTTAAAERLAAACSRAGAELVAVDSNPLDAVWTERPAPPLGAVTLHPAKYAGESADDKLGRIRGELARGRLDALVLSDSHAVAWTFNIRGADVAHTPLPLSYAILPKDGRPVIFIDARKLSNAVRDHLEQTADVAAPEALTQQLADLARTGATIGLDATTAADALSRLITAAGGRPMRGADPTALLKAAKNTAEIAGTRTAHERDGVALARFLAWIDREAPTGALTEIDTVEALETFRRETGALKDVSFPTIAGTGPNGAIVHYRVTRKSNRRIALGDLLLIDSGAQYEDGTTDVTRTIAIGTPTDEMRDRFTRVLRGHIAIARAVFPDGTSGAQIDAFARQFLWQAGLDFEHGTGHGVGSYLSVHEGPARISKLGTTPLKRGMILSNEPGYYKTEAYGIRIENLELVVAAERPGAEKAMNGFETLTLAPIDRRLIDPAQMTGDEIQWIDAYHTRVRDTLRGSLDDATRIWLDAATLPLKG